MRRALGVALVAALALGAGCREQNRGLKVGSKVFAESEILAEISVQFARRLGVPAIHMARVGRTPDLWKALERGEIDAYPEYTGTLAAELLPGVDPSDRVALRAALAARGLAMTQPLGFENTYALGIKSDKADRMGIRRISDLKDHPELKLGFTHEFLQRQDGWAGLSVRYLLPQAEVHGVDHDDAYEAIAADKVDVTDVYSTDAEISRHRLRVLVDDLGYFPDYQAIIVYRLDVAWRIPGAVEALERLAGKIPSGTMITLNARAAFDKAPPADIAGLFIEKDLDATKGPTVASTQPTAVERFLARTSEHVMLAVVGLTLALLVGFSIGLVLARLPALRLPVGVLGELIETLPLMVVLVLASLVLGMGAKAALPALALAGLVPIARGTYEGLQAAAGAARATAEAIGLSARATTRLVLVPLALPHVLDGMRRGAILVAAGTTVAGLIGAGGHGQTLLVGLMKGSRPMILEGALASAALAIGVHLLYAAVARLVVAEGLRGKKRAA